MSFILDALNRSESERSTVDSVPGIQTVHGAPENGGHSLWRKALWPALLAALAVIALVLWQSEAETDAAATAAADRQSNATMASEAAPASIDTATEAVQRSSAPVSGARSESEPTPEPVAQEPLQVSPEAAADPDVAALYRTAEASAATRPQAGEGARRQLPARRTARAEDRPAVTEDRLDVDVLAEAAADALAEHRGTGEPVIEHEAPFIVDLRQSLKDQIPSIFYSAHNWATNPAQRSVVLNGEMRRAGQQIKPGLKLVEILEDSIVLDYKGTEFRLRSLNSWVNL